MRPCQAFPLPHFHKFGRRLQLSPSRKSGGAHYALVICLVRTKQHMIAGGLNPRQLFSIDTTGILMKGKTSLNHFTISVDKISFYKVNVWLIKLISSYCCFDLWKFLQSLLASLKTKSYCYLLLPVGQRTNTSK